MTSPTRRYGGNDPVARLTNEVEDLKRQVRALSRRPQLSHSSIDDGALQLVTDGSLTGLLGKQFDGTTAAVTVAGPTPPEPEVPTVEPVLGGLRAVWDGTWATSPTTVAPMDFARVEVHMSTDPNLTGILFDTLVGTIESARGGQVTAPFPPGAQVYCRIIARSVAGKVGRASQTVGPITPGGVNTDNLEVDISDLGGTRIYWQAAEPVNVPLTYGDLWLKQTSVSPAQYAMHRWIEANPDRWEPVADTKVAQATADALLALNAARTAEDQALQALAQVDSAFASAAAALDAADGAIKTYFATGAPVGLTVDDVGDLWFDTDDGNRIYRWSGTAWVAADDTRLATAIATAAGAQATADGKVTTYYQATAPTAQAVGDLWVETDFGNRLYRWSGTTWVALDFGAGALAVTARDLGAITTYYQPTAPSAGLVPGDFWLDTDDGNKLHRWSGTTWVVVQDAAIQTALTSAGNAAAVADSKVRIFTQANPPAGLTAGDVGDLWIDTDDGNKIYTWSGSAWTARTLGNAAITPNSLIASNVVATGTVTAALLEAVMILSSRIVIGTATGARIDIQASGITQVEADGSVSFQLQPGGSTYFAGVLTGRSANFTEANEGWMISEDGDASFQDLHVYDNFTASTVSTTVLTVQGRSIFDLLSYKPQGLVAVGFVTSLTKENIGADEVGLVELSFTAQPGRGYTITTSGPMFAASNDTTAPEFRWRAAFNGAAPTIASTQIGTKWENPPRVNGAEFLRKTLTHSFVWYPAVGSQQKVRVLLSVRRAFGNGTIGCYTSGFDRVQMAVYDEGVSVPNALVINGHQATNPPPAPTAAPSIHEDTYFSTWSASYYGNGSKRNSGGDMFQGQTPFYVSHGNQKSAVGFDVTAIRSALSGATLHWAKLYILNRHTHYYAGGEIVIGSHNSVGEPGTFPGGFLDRSRTHTAKGAWCEVDITGIVNEIKNNTSQGVLVGPGPNTAEGYYSYWAGDGSSTPPRFVVRYEK